MDIKLWEKLNFRENHGSGFGTAGIQVRTGKIV